MLDQRLTQTNQRKNAQIKTKFVMKKQVKRFHCENYHEFSKFYDFASNFVLQFGHVISMFPFLRGTRSRVLHVSHVKYL